ncbi:MAG: diphthamide biosynthesis enzyme Dph2 [Candidatus Parvarchaeota archaeon]|nr:diphthamide biosynthesis enzyme Dph2 [Candidatus Jingweiarchaeum tengchongense]MCW1304819.1 diphthamide biosynthesis enzyme Dph2 [Candidatus Jingweiarchaeum tengchongense]MCW1305409.1 diphthamide biosynthesis enzyme Dph2 [Candidatus Jingweiarchaeum tengchongense]
MNVIYIPCFYKRGIDNELLQKIVENLKEEKIGIFSVVQFSKNLKKIKKFLEDNNKKVFLGRSVKLGKVGQVLGCDISSCEKIKEKVDCFLFIGSGIFHPILVALKTNKDVYIANPLTKEVSKISRKEIEKFKRKNEENIRKFKNAKRIGILVSTKPGQENLKIALDIKKEIEKNNRKAFIFIFDTLIPEELMNFTEIDAWVNTACPRIGIDDAERFDKPVINVEDFYAIV